MSQFDAYALPDGTWVVDVQSDFVTDYNTRLVAPLVPPDEDATPVTRLNPLLAVAGERRLLAMQLAAAVPKRILREPIASLAKDGPAIKAALDMLICGF